jgi:hypothetical protein
MTDVSQVILALAAALAAGTPDPAPSGAPVRLIAESVGTGVRLRVVGNSAAACEARYELAVSGDTIRGGNRSIQRGTARLQAGVPATLATVSLGSVNPKGWEARLSVEPCDGARYVQVLGNAG